MRALHWTGSDLRNNRRVRRTWLAYHVTTSQFIFTVHIRSKSRAPVFREKQEFTVWS